MPVRSVQYRERKILRSQTCGPEYSVQYWLETLAAFLQSVEIVSLTQRGSVYSVEWQPLESHVAN